MKTFPTLYKKTNTGAIQQWTIGVRGHPNFAPSVAIYTWHGQVDGKFQETFDMIKEGKNTGKKNATTPEQQAIAEAKAKWEKQKKKGYVESIESAKVGELDELIEGGIEPMLAHSFSKQGHKIKYPAYIQPKLDGIRCIAILKDRKCTLWSRTRKPITSMPHIIAEIEKHFIADIILDGELYNHDFKTNFEHIVSMVRQEEPAPQHTDVQYHVYDIVNSDTFNKRRNKLFKCFTIGESKLQYLKLVETLVCLAENNVIDYFNLFVKNGYEGAMLRNSESLYVNKRSYDLQKVKEFDDAEFKIIGAEEGRGKLMGHVGAFICENFKGQQFKVKMSGDTEKLAEYFNNSSLYLGKQLTVQYQGLTGKEGVPRFPVGLRIRNE